MNLRGVLSNWELFAGSPQAVPRLRELILQLAVQGKLVPQDPKEEPASVLLKKIKAEKERLAKEGKIKRDKPLAEIEEEEKPFELPTGWEWVHLATLAEQITKGTTPTTFGHSYTSEGVNFVKIENLDRGRLNLAQITDFISPETHEIMSRSQLSAGDLLFSIAGTIGKTAVVLEEDLPANTNQALAIIKGAAKHVNQRFLLLALDSFVSKKVKDKARGGAMNNISLGDLSELLMTIPPLAEQSRIVTRVQELMQLCDALEAKVTLEAQQHETLLRTLLATLTQSASSEDLAQNWQRVSDHFPLLLDRPQAIDALEQTILQLAVRGLLVPQNPMDEPASQLLKKIRAEKDKLIQEGKIKRDKPLPPIAEDEQPFELPTGWEWTRLGDVAVIASGVTLGRKTSVPCPVSLPYLRVANVQRWHLNMTSIKEVVIDQSELQRFRLQNGDLLIIEGGDWDKVGRTAIWRDEIATCLHQNHVLRARGTSSDWNPIWAELFLNSAVARAYFETAAKQTTNLASINMTQLKNCAFPLPPLPEQHRIVTRVTELRQLCAALRSRLAQSSQIQAQLAQALVSQQG